ncbi:patatin-like phospholipase family protein [Halonatronum saccharophilum]|uniref:patatin-like phospholipase family protein n=1 Tax=Halonatronum saccharophilum TaxID=150060 RepID=UPI00048693FC|nr:patatin-like phospholipase family protein [Halonatronum saccharophilum]
MRRRKIRINLSLNGGGVRGISHVGGIEALEDYGFEIVALAGSSAGAIVASLYGAGYSLDELKEIMYEQDFSEFKDSFSIIRLIRDYGIYKGDQFLRWIEEKLQAKGVKEFKDLEREVKIISSEVTCKKDQVFSKEDTPRFSVAKAVRMSMGIPIFYVPYIYKGRYYVDGGVTNNLPLKVFDRSRRPTLGFILAKNEDEEQENINGFLNYLTALIEMVIAVNEKRQIELSNSHIISISTGDIKATDFSLSQEQKKELYELGYWGVEDTISRYRDRRLLRGLNSINKNNLKATTVEVEEFSELMVVYIQKNIDLSSFETVVALDDDDYLLSYLVARKLNKKFSVINLRDRRVESKYNNLHNGDRVILLNYLDISAKDMRSLCMVLEGKGIDIAGEFSFIDRGGRRGKAHLELVRHSYYKL